MTGPRTCAMLLASRAIGGEERFLSELAIAMRRTPVRPVILNLKSPMPYASELGRHGVEFLDGLADDRFDPLGLVRLIRVVQRIGPEVLLINSNRQAMLLGGPAGRWCGVPTTLVHTHEHQGRTATTMRWMARFGDGIVAPAHSHREYLRSALRLPPDRIAVVYPGVNAARTTDAGAPGEGGLPTAGGGHTVGIVAALRPEKDHETFLRAAAVVVTRMPEARFLVIGDGLRRPELERVASNLHLTRHVTFLGWQPVDAKLLRTLDVLALSSVSETFPAVILEAFGAGVPVVATNVGSVPELFGTPPVGVLVPPRSPDSLAQAIITLLGDRAAAQRLVARARRRAQYFSADRFCRDLLSLVQRIAAAKAQGGSRDISRLLVEAPDDGRLVED